MILQSLAFFHPECGISFAMSGATGTPRLAQVCMDAVGVSSLIYRDLSASFTLSPSLCFMYFDICLCVASGHPKLGCIPNEGSIVHEQAC